MTDKLGQTQLRIISSGLPHYVKEIILFRKSNKDYCEVDIFGRRFNRTEVSTRLTVPLKEFPSGAIDKVSVEEVLSLFSDTIEEVKGSWLGSILYAEAIGSFSQHPSYNEEAYNAYTQFADNHQDKKEEILSRAKEIAGREDYLNNYEAVVFLTKELISVGIPIKNPELIKEAILATADEIDGQEG